MPYPIDKKLVITVTSSALFDMRESDEIFRTQGVDGYRQYQEENIDKTFEKGVAFPFIRRILSLNEVFQEEQPIEVVLFSKNSPDAGNRAMRSIAKYGLNISRFLFTSGDPNFQYLPAYNSTLFLTSNPDDTKAAISAGYAAGTVLNKSVVDDEKIYKDKGMEVYRAYETENASNPLSAGPLEPLLKKISTFRKMEKRRAEKDPTYTPILRTAIVTARNAPAHERVLTTLKEWDIDVDQLFFLGGMDKSLILNIMKPHIFFDDQMIHLENLDKVPAVHIPFGVANK